MKNLSQHITESFVNESDDSVIGQTYQTGKWDDHGAFDKKTIEDSSHTGNFALDKKSIVMPSGTVFKLLEKSGPFFNTFYKLEIISSKNDKIVGKEFYVRNLMFGLGHVSKH